MTTIKFMRYLSVLLLLIVSEIASATDEIRFDNGQLISYATDLFDQEDFLRSISVLKIIQYFSHDDSVRKWCNFKIGEAYFKSGDYSRANIHMRSYLKSGNDRDLVYRSWSYVGAGHLHKREYQLASDSFKKATELNSEFALWTAYSDVYAHGVDEGIGTFRLLGGNAETDNEVIALDMANALERGVKRKLNPTTASVLSSFIPGLGQFYARHYYDAVQSLVLVGSFGYMSYASYKLGNLGEQGHLLTGISCLVTGLFHYANILGAGKTVKYRNRLILNRTLSDIRLTIEKESGFSIKFGFK